MTYYFNSYFYQQLIAQLNSQDSGSSDANAEKTSQGNYFNPENLGVLTLSGSFFKTQGQGNSYALPVNPFNDNQNSAKSVEQANKDHLRELCKAFISAKSDEERSLIESKLDNFVSQKHLEIDSKKDLDAQYELLNQCSTEEERLKILDNINAISFEQEQKMNSLYLDSLRADLGLVSDSADRQFIMSIMDDIAEKIAVDERLFALNSEYTSLQDQLLNTADEDLSKQLSERSELVYKELILYQESYLDYLRNKLESTTDPSYQNHILSLIADFNAGFQQGVVGERASIYEELQLESHNKYIESLKAALKNTTDDAEYLKISDAIEFQEYSFKITTELNQKCKKFNEILGYLPFALDDDSYHKVFEQLKKIKDEIEAIQSDMMLYLVERQAKAQTEEERSKSDILITEYVKIVDSYKAGMQQALDVYTTEEELAALKEKTGIDFTV